MATPPQLPFHLHTPPRVPSTSAQIWCMATSGASSPKWRRRSWAQIVRGESLIDDRTPESSQPAAGDRTISLPHQPMPAELLPPDPCAIVAANHCGCQSATTRGLRAAPALFFLHGL